MSVMCFTLIHVVHFLCTILAQSVWFPFFSPSNHKFILPLKLFFIFLTEVETFSCTTVIPHVS